jgi:hypothetical protein
LATNAPRILAEFELGILKLDEKTFFDAVLIADEFGIGIFEFFSFNFFNSLLKFKVNQIQIFI